MTADPFNPRPGSSGGEPESGYDIGALARYAETSGRQRLPWREGAVPDGLQGETVEGAALRLDLPIPTCLWELYEEHAGAEHELLGTLIHPGVLRPASEIDELAAIKGGRQILPIFNRDDDYLCLDFRARGWPGHSSRPPGSPTVCLARGTGGAPLQVYDSAEDLIERLGFSPLVDR